MLFDPRVPWDEQTPEEIPGREGTKRFFPWAWSPDGKWLAGDWLHDSGFFDGGRFRAGAIELGGGLGGRTNGVAPVGGFRPFQAHGNSSSDEPACGTAGAVARRCWNFRGPGRA